MNTTAHHNIPYHFGDNFV